MNPVLHLVLDTAQVKKSKLSDLVCQCLYIALDSQVNVAETWRTCFDQHSQPVDGRITQGSCRLRLRTLPVRQGCRAISHQLKHGLQVYLRLNASQEKLAWNRCGNEVSDPRLQQSRGRCRRVCMTQAYQRQVLARHCTLELGTQIQRFRLVRINQYQMRVCYS